MCSLCRDAAESNISLHFSQLYPAGSDPWRPSVGLGGAGQGLGAGFRVQSLCVKVWGSRCGAPGLGLRVEDLGFGIEG